MTTFASDEALLLEASQCSVQAFVRKPQFAGELFQVSRKSDFAARPAAFSPQAVAGAVGRRPQRQSFESSPRSLQPPGKQDSPFAREVGVAPKQRSDLGDGEGEQRRGA